MNEPAESFDATALRLVREKRPGLFQESIRIFHDRDALNEALATYRASEVVAIEYPLLNQPIFGPVEVFSRSAPQRSHAEPASDSFGINRFKAVIPKQGAGEHAVGESAAGPAEARQERFDQYLHEIQVVFALQRSTAPVSSASIDPWWEANVLRSWVAVHYLLSDGSGRNEERLDLVTLPVTADTWPLSARASLGRAEQHALDQSARLSMELLMFEAMDCALKLNNNQLFAIERRAKLSLDGYVRDFVL